MSNRDRVLEFLRNIGDAGATNERIVSHTGIRPHQQVFMITRDLMRIGRIKGIQSSKEWTFWIADEQTPMARSDRAPLQMGPTLSENELTPAEFEQLARITMSGLFGALLSRGRVPGVPKLFDCVSDDREIVGDAKFYTLKRFPFDLNRWDFQEVIDERVFVH